MSAEPRISIAMATYNGARYIREQLDSLAAQTLLPCELVVTDDGSTDATLEIVADFASIAPFPVRVHRNENRLGFGENFLRATSLCEGEYIAFCDQDDVWLPKKLARCVISLDHPSVLLCVHSAELIDESGNIRGRRFPDYQSYTRHATSDNPWDLSYPGFAMIFRRDLIKLFLPIARRISPRLEFCFGAHDLFVNFIAANLGDTVFLSEGLAWYRQHEAHTCGAPQVWGIREKLRKTLDTNLTQYIGMSHIAAERESIISAFSSEIQGSYDVNAERSAARYRHLRTALTRRMERYEVRAPFASVPGIVKAILHGDYGRKSKGGLGGRAIIKDFLHALVPGLLSSTKNRRTSYEK
jgi:glycosyltransferase involved in cell wall biosynthesis